MLCGLALPEALDFLLNAGVGLVVCKMGGRGARLVGRRVDLYVPPQPAEVVDVTGAGDLFAAGFVAGMLEQVGLEARRPSRRLGRVARHRRPRAKRVSGRGGVAGAARRGARGDVDEAAVRRRRGGAAVKIGWLSTGPRPGGQQPALRHRRARPAGRRRARHRRRVLRPRAGRGARERPLPRPGRAPRLRGRDAVERRELGGGQAAGAVSRRLARATTTAASSSCCALRPRRCSCMAGYMLIVSPAMCRRYAILNLHPALPGGPTGTWQQVIWQLLEQEAEETGAMIHRATRRARPRSRDLVLPPARSSATAWDDLWQEFREKRATASVAEIAAAEGEAEPLFAEIRRRGEVREIPLLYQTLRLFAEGAARDTMQRRRLRRVVAPAPRPDRAGRGRARPAR